MRRKKKPKTIDDVSVTKLLDDFVDLDVEESKRKEMDDDEYIRMMVEKEEARKRERVKRNPRPSTHDIVATPEEQVEKTSHKEDKPLEEVFPETCEHDLSPEDEALRYCESV